MRGFNYRLGVAKTMGSNTSLSSTIPSYYLTVLVAFLMTAVIATPFTSSDLSASRSEDTSGRSDYWITGSVSLINDDAGAYSSIAVSDSGVMHIAHVDPNNGELLYSTNTTNTTWSTENFTFGVAPNASLQTNLSGKTAIAIDSQGDVHITFRAKNSQNSSIYDLWHMKQVSNGGWAKSGVSSGRDMGHHLSLTIDSSDIVHIAYRDNTNGELRYAKNTSQCWYCWNDTAVTQPSGSVITGGFFTSIATDSNNNPFIVHCDSTSSTGFLQLLSLMNGSYWAPIKPDGQGKGCKQTSMDIFTPDPAVGGSDEIHISYARDENSDNQSELRYTTNKSGSWNGENVVGGGLGSTINQGWTSIAVDSLGYPHIAYTAQIAKYALKDDSGAWSTEIIGQGYQAEWISIALNSNDLPYVSYYNPGPSDLYYGTFVHDSESNPVEITGTTFYNVTSDILYASWLAQNLTSGTTYKVDYQLLLDGALEDNGSNIWVQPATVTSMYYSNYTGWANLIEGEWYCVKIYLYNDTNQLAMDETCHTIPNHESITSQPYFDTDTDRLYFDYIGADLVSGNSYRAYYNLMYENGTSIGGHHANATFSATGSSYSGSQGSVGYWSQEGHWMIRGDTYCVYVEIAHTGASNILDSNTSCVTIPSGSGNGEDVISYLNFDTASENLTADIDSSSLTLGESYGIFYYLWQSEEGEDTLIDEGAENFTAASDSFVIWDEWGLSTPENANGINRGNTYCLQVRLFIDDPSEQVATDNSCVTIPTSGGGGNNSWTMEVLDSSRSEGFGSSMAIDDNGNIHVSYYDYYMSSDLEIRYGFFDGENWYTETIDIGLGSAGVHSTALDLDDNGCPVILYYSEDARQLRIQYSMPSSSGGTPCSWDPEPVIVASETSGTAYNVHALYSLAVEGAGSSLVTHISYTFYCENEPNWNGDLMYASFDESEDTEWQFETIATSSLTGFNSIKLDDNGDPHIAYYDADMRTIYYTYFEQLGCSCWSTETIANDVNLLGAGSILSLDLGPNWLNTASVAYVEASDSMLKLVVRSGGPWLVTNIADTNGGADNSLAFDHNGNQNIAFTEGGMSPTDSNTLKFAHHNGEVWNVATIDSGGNEENRVGINPSLVYDQNGKPIVSHLDYTTGNLRFICNGCSIFDEGSNGSGFDADGDGIEDWEDNCPNTTEGETVDSNGCSTNQNGSGEDLDSDGIWDENDECPDGNNDWTSDPTTDYDADGCKDGTEDWDDDNDGIDDADDSCYNGETGWDTNTRDPVIDHDHDGCLDSTEDDDDDNDGYNDPVDTCPLTRVGAGVDTSGCETSFDDEDGDGVADSVDDCSSTVLGRDVDWYGCEIWEDQDEDDIPDWDDNCPDTPIDTEVDEDGCLIDDSEIIDDIEDEVKGEWYEELPFIGKYITILQTQYGQYISMATVGATIIFYLVRAVTMRSDHKRSKRVEKFKRDIRGASSAKELRGIQNKIERAEDKRLLPEGAFGDLLSLIELRAEDIGLSSFIPDDTIEEAGIDLGDFAQGLAELRHMQEEMGNRIYGESMAASAAGASGGGRGRPSHQALPEAKRQLPKGLIDINDDGKIDEVDLEIWESLSPEEKRIYQQRQMAKDHGLVSEIVAFSRLPNGPKARCNCGSGKQYSKCHMRRTKCPCNSGRPFVKCCAKKRGYL